MPQRTDRPNKPEDIVKTIRLADELERLQNRISDSRFMREADCPEKQRVVTARRVKLSAAW